MLNLFPLPLWFDGREALTEILDEAQVRDQPGSWRNRGRTKSKAAKALRGNGLRAWHGLVVVALNHLYGDEPRGERPCAGGQATAAQEQALNTLWELVKSFIDERERAGVPRSSQEDWGHAIDDLKVSYTGEVLEKAVPLTLAQVLPGLPSVEHGGSVDIMEVLPPHLQEALKHPEKMMVEPPQGPRPHPKVRVVDGEWPKIARALFDRGLIRPVNHCPVLDGEKVLNGAFGVGMPDKVTEKGEPVLRLIMDLRATNYCMKQIDGEVGHLCGAASFQRVVIESGQELLVSGEDLTAGFCLFRLPEEWSNYMVLEKPVARSELGLAGDGETLLGLSVLPMGWHSAVGLMQACHRAIALRSASLGGAGLKPLAEISKAAIFPDCEVAAGWSIYLDDTTVLEKVQMVVAEQLAGSPAEEQKQLRQAYAWWGIPTDAAKSLERVRQTERLGALIDDEAGVLRTKTKRSLDLFGYGSWIRGCPQVPRKALQVYAGKAVHILQFRRCLFSIMEEIVAMIAHGGEVVTVSDALAEEMLLLEALLPLAHFDLKAKVDPVVTCSDASESGGGLCFSSRLSWAGRAEAEWLMKEGSERDPQQLDVEVVSEEKILVIDLFGGLGGLEVALEKAGVKVLHSLMVEKDVDCRRLLRRKYPGSDFCSDITKFNEVALEEGDGEGAWPHRHDSRRWEPLSRSQPTFVGEGPAGGGTQCFVL